ncbi:MAG: hypothetical protein RMI35_04985 [Leptospiraceae bacterium]|nr:hypothetical protein [Leptospiraceae bacterium]
MKKLIQWFSNHQRRLSFRNTKEPYKIWIAEVMLQQTRIGSVVNSFQSKYDSFIQKFPDVFSLAQAPVEEVYRAWSGLGYYQRAKNLHKTAQILVEKYQGNFPKSYQELLKLPGIGDYTASAILSIAFDLPYAVFDGNVRRVIFRFFYFYAKEWKDVKAKEISQFILTEYRPTPSLYNQALMELGSTICIQKFPKCSVCVVKEYCDATSLPREVIQNIPKNKKTPKTKKQLYVYIITKQDQFLLVKNQNLFFKHHYSFPFFEKKLSELENVVHLGNIRHHIMNYEVHANVFFVDYEGFQKYFNNNQDFIWVTKEKIEHYLYTSFFKKIYHLYQSYSLFL